MCKIYDFCHLFSVFISINLSSLSFRLHLRVHHDDKRYECDECGKTFIRHDHLKKHKKIHTGIFYFDSRFKWTAAIFFFAKLCLKPL